MIVFYKERLVFLSVPKTGTSAYQQALGERASMVIRHPPELKHSALYRYNRWFRPMFERVCNTQLETMAVIREPISWLGSWYRYRQRPHLDGKSTSTRDVSFDDFVLAYLKGKRPDFANVGSQARFVEKRPNGSEISHLFRYEDPARLHGFLEDRLSLRLDLPRVNVSPKRDLELSPKVEQRLRRKFSEEFELYDSIPGPG